MKRTSFLAPITPLGPLDPIDLTDASFKANPFPFYARLRAEAPVFPVMVRGKQRAWLVTRYDDVLSVLKDDARFVKDKNHAMSLAQLKQAPRLPALFGALERNLLGLDGADHDRLKVLVHKAFTPRMIEQMREHTQLVTNETLDKAERKGTIDLIADFALPVPLAIIGRILGVPKADTPKFSRWMKAFMAVGSNRNPVMMVPSLLVLMNFMGYLRGLIKTRRAHPEADLISALARAQAGDDQLTDDEVLAMIFLLLSAGHETTVNLIGSGTLALLENPTQLLKLRSEPTLIKSAIEELVRYAVPVEMATERYAAQAVKIAGVLIPKGEMVLAIIASANRDEAYFENPDRLDIARENNKHLSFGQGLHYCLGAPLSRMEAQIAIGTLIQRMPNLRLSIPAHQVSWRPSFIVRGLESLPVSF